MKQIYLSIISAVFAIHSFSQNIVVSDTIPLAINEQNTISIKAVFNDIDTLNLNFDTGTTELILTQHTIDTKLASKISLYDTDYNLQIGKNSYKTKVYDAALAGHGTDGRFGWDFFKDKVVELNYDKEILIIHSQLPQYITTNPDYTKHNIVYFKDLFFLQGTLQQNRIETTDNFLFDTGYERTLMLNSNLLTAQNFPVKKMKEIKRVMMKGGQGNEIPVVTSNLRSLKIGSHKLKNVPVQVSNANKPFKEKDIHVLGNEILKRFNILLDFQNDAIYLAPNKHYKAVYIEAKKD